MFTLKPRASRLFKEWVHLFIFAFFLFAGRSAIADWNRIPSGSMEPTLYVGDLIWVNKLAYDLKVPFTTCLNGPILNEEKWLCFISLAMVRDW